jgi:hypothetical protein
MMVRASCNEGQVVGIGYPTGEDGFVAPLTELFCVPGTRRPVNEAAFECIYSGE